MKIRVPYIDYLKGFAIILVVMGHCMVYSLIPDAKQLVDSISFKILSSFHMPLFFFISGYLAYKIITPGSIKNEVVKKIRTLLLPFLTVGVLYALLHNNLKGLFFGEMKLGYWFTFVLFQAFILLYPLMLLSETIQRWTKSNSDIVHFLIDALLFGSVIIGLELIYISNVIPQDIYDFMQFSQLRLYFIFFAFGFFCRKYVKLDNLLKNSNLLYSLSLIVFAALLVLSYSYYHHIVLLLMALAGIICVYHFFVRTTDFWPAPVTNTLAYLGKHSLEIYLLHYFFLVPSAILTKYIPVELLANSAFALQFFITLFFSILVILLSLLSAYIIDSSQILRFLFFGKK